MYEDAKEISIDELLGTYGMIEEEKEKLSECRERSGHGGGDIYNVYGDHALVGNDAKHNGDIIDVDGDYSRDSKTTILTSKEKEPWYKIAHPILAIIVSLIVILGFVTGIKSCRDLLDKTPSLSPTTQPNTPSDSKLRIDPNRVDANMPVSKPSGG